MSNDFEMEDLTNPKPSDRTALAYDAHEADATGTFSLWAWNSALLFVNDQPL